MNIMPSTTNAMNTVPYIWEQGLLSNQSPPAYVEYDNDTPRPQEDTVRVSGAVSANLQEARLLSDEEAETVLEDTIGILGSDSGAALNVHEGLDAARVAALLAF